MWRQKFFAGGSGCRNRNRAVSAESAFRGEAIRGALPKATCRKRAFSRTGGIESGWTSGKHLMQASVNLEAGPVCQGG
jgi:hypothetical protein